MRLRNVLNERKDLSLRWEMMNDGYGEPYEQLLPVLKKHEQELRDALAESERADLWWEDESNVLELLDQEEARQILASL